MLIGKFHLCMYVCMCVCCVCVYTDNPLSFKGELAERKTSLKIHSLSNS
jgi:hypothetical protein